MNNNFGHGIAISGYSKCLATICSCMSGCSARNVVVCVCRRTVFINGYGDRTIGENNGTCRGCGHLCSGCSIDIYICCGWFWIHCYDTLSIDTRTIGGVCSDCGTTNSDSGNQTIFINSSN